MLYYQKLLFYLLINNNYSMIAQKGDIKFLFMVLNDVKFNISIRFQIGNWSSDALLGDKYDKLHLGCCLRHYTLTPYFSRAG